MSGMTTTTAAAVITEAINFDEVIDRANTGSAKWDLFGEDVLPMWVADMDFKSPQPVIDALTERVAHGVFGYQMGMPELSELLVERMARLYNWTIKPDEIIYLPGLVPGLFLTSRIFGGDPGGILMQTPVYPPFIYGAKHFQRPVHNVDLVETTAPDGTLRYEIDFDAFEAAIQPDTKVFFLCNPHNPVGRAYTPAELTRMAEICAKHDLMIVSDDIHCDLLLDDGLRHVPIASLSPEISARTVTLMAPSKTFNIAGLGASFAIVQDETIRARLKAESHGPLPGVNVLAFTAALAAYQHGQPWLDALLPYLKTNRDILVDFVQKELPSVRITRPEATYLAWLDFRALNLPDNDPFKLCLEQGKLALNNGKDFGQSGQGFARLNFGTSRVTLMQGLERLRTALHSVIAPV